MPVRHHAFSDGPDAHASSMRICHPAFWAQPVARAQRRVRRLSPRVFSRSPDPGRQITCGVLQWLSMDACPDLQHRRSFLAIGLLSPTGVVLGGQTPVRFTGRSPGRPRRFQGWRGRRADRCGRDGSRRPHRHRPDGGRFRGAPGRQTADGDVWSSSTRPVRTRSTARRLVRLARGERSQRPSSTP